MAVEIAKLVWVVLSPLVAPVGRQLGYMFYFNANVETLQKEAEKLNDLKVSVQMKVDAAQRNNEIIELFVEKWQVDTAKAGDVAQTIILDKAEFPKGCFNRWFLNLKPRYVLSRKAKKKTKDIVRLQEDHGKWILHPAPIAYPAPIIPVVASSSTIGTRKLILDEIITKLKDDSINMINICGMGGVGKTTMAKEVLKRVEEEKLFDDCAMAVISQKQDLPKVQNDIAELLGLRLDEQNPIAREAKLHTRLENKRVLIILDDVWEEFDLSVLGITSQVLERGCKVLCTSREQGLWRKIPKKIDFPLDVLSGEEAWDLFEGMVSDSLIENPVLQSLAKEIVRECGGLPLALVTVGGFLGVSSTHVWKDTLRQLKTYYPKNIRGVYKKVYQSIELSYNFLENEDSKSLFLLCCLFEEDFQIYVEDLVPMALGLRLLEGINSLEPARDRVFTLIDQLKHRYLLLLGKSDKFIKMHDVVRDVAKSIASVERGALVVENVADLRLLQEQVMLKNFVWITLLSTEIRELPRELISHRVELLRCTVLETTDSLFDGMEGLQVLDVQDNRLNFSRLPSMLRYPSSLRTLYFRNVKKIPVIKDLPNLEILSFRESFVEELPIEEGHLANLVSLDLNNCSSLKTIRPGIISGLRQLQELYMGNIEVDWEGEEKEGRNASLSEFESLSNLHTLHIHIKDPSVLPRFPLFSNLKKYRITIGEKIDFLTNMDVCFSIHLPTFVPSLCDIKILSKNAEELLIEGDFTKDVVLQLVQDGSHQLKSLRVKNVNALDYLSSAEASLLFINAESLHLSYLENLRHISRQPLIMGSFKKLKELWVGHCKKLRNIFQLLIVRELVHLQTLTIYSCDSMEEVFWKEIEDANNKLVFPELEDLEINGLPKLISFCRDIDEMEFPQLNSLKLHCIPQIEILFSNLSSQSIFPRKVSFPSLEYMSLENLKNMKEIWCDQVCSVSFLNLAEMSVSFCHKLRVVVTSSMARNLVHLKSLKIFWCSLLERVVAIEEEDDEHQNLFPKLEEVHLVQLPVLESFSLVAHDLEFPVLKYVRVSECPQLMTFTRGFVNTPNLHEVEVKISRTPFKNSRSIQSKNFLVGNLNNTIQELQKQASVDWLEKRRNWQI